MLIHSQTVEAHRVGKFELVEIVVVQLVSDLGVIQAARDIDPHAAILFLEVVRQEPVRHQMEPGKFHTFISLCACHLGQPEDRAATACDSSPFSIAIFSSNAVLRATSFTKCDSSASWMKCSGSRPVMSRKRLSSPSSMNAPLILAHMTAAVLVDPSAFAISPAWMTRAIVRSHSPNTSWLRARTRLWLRISEARLMRSVSLVHPADCWVRTISRISRR